MGGGETARSCLDRIEFGALARSAPISVELTEGVSALSVLPTVQIAFANSRPGVRDPGICVERTPFIATVFNASVTEAMSRLARHALRPTGWMTRLGLEDYD